MSKKTKEVQMGLWEETIEKVNDLKDWMGAPSKTQVVANCVGIVHYIYKAYRNGGNLYIKDSDGRVETLELKSDD